MNVKKFIIYKKISSRYLVHKILNGVFIDKKTKNQTLEYLTRKNFFFEEKDLAQADRLANLIFGHLESIDNILLSVLKKKTNKSVFNILRIVIAELALKEAPIYASVSSAVNLAKISIKTKHFAGLVNSVSKSLVRIFQEKNIILKSNLENNFKNYLIEKYSQEIAKKIERIYTLHNSIDISIINQEEVEHWKEKLGAKLLPTGSLRIKKNKKLSDLSGFKEGKWWVQDISSSIPIKLIDKIKNMEVLDLFSAPGGKAMQLIALGANVTCIDSSSIRIKKLQENLTRMNMKADVFQTDFYDFKSKKKFDLVLIDVPCSSTGTIRKNKEIQYLDPFKRLKNLLKIQEDSLNVAKNFVKDKGYILYCNCSLFFSEGEDKIRNFIKENSNWEFEKFIKKNKHIEKDWIDKSGFLRLRPDHLYNEGGMDGFFAALLKKIN